MSRAARRGIVVFVVGLVAVLVAFGADRLWLAPQTASDAAGVNIGGPFTLVDQNGQTRRDSDFRGKLMLVYFGYTFCPDACPTALQTMTAALDDLGDAGKDVQPIFITVDPERDTVAQLKAYAANFHPRLIALTGTPAETDAAARAYRIYYQKDKPDAAGNYLVDHSSFIYLMGRDGHYLAHFGPDATAATIAAAIKQRL